LVGDEEGKVSLIKLSKSFYDTNNKTEVDNKKNMLNKLFEREQTKEKMLTAGKKIPPPKEGMKPEKIEQIRKQKIKEIEEKYQEYTKEFRESPEENPNPQDAQQANEPPKEGEAQENAAPQS
jgi:hypothetical protein